MAEDLQQPESVTSDDDIEKVRALLGREPQGQFRVVVRDDEGEPVVIENAPLLDDGTPMPTTYWLVDRDLSRRIGTLEAMGGVRAAEAEIDPQELQEAHERYAAERDRRIPSDWDGPRPSGGVGGTRQGVKCLHAHYAWFLAGGDDPVGRWVDRRLRTPGGIDEDLRGVRHGDRRSTVDGERNPGGVP